jgi:hypothetical protein
VVLEEMVKVYRQMDYMQSEKLTWTFSIGGLRRRIWQTQYISSPKHKPLSLHECNYRLPNKNKPKYLVSVFPLLNQLWCSLIGPLGWTKQLSEVSEFSKILNMLKHFFKYIENLWLVDKG